MSSMLLDILLVMAGWTISLISGAELAACPTGTVEQNVTSTGDLQSLTDAMNCSGQGVFNVTLYSSVQLRTRIEVSDDKTVHITGSGLPTLRAAVRGNNEPSADTDTGNTTGIFLVSNGSTLNISALILEGGYSEYGGAVTVLSSSSLHAFGCTFRDNSAATGGAVYAQDADVHIDGATKFEHNSANKGGAMYANGSEVDINGNTFFSDNSVGGVRGLVYTNGSQADISGYPKFGYSSNESYGGAISMEYSEFHVYGFTYFEDNLAAYGGGIHVYASDVSISGMTTFVNNLALMFGGAMYIVSSVASLNGSTYFVHNSAVRYGGAMSVDLSDIYIEGTTYFANNVANFGGGALEAYRSQVIIDGDTTFVNHSTASYGGAVYVELQSQVTIDGSAYFANNSAMFLGGGIYMTEGNVTIVSNASFVNNSAGTGGGIYCGWGSLVVSSRGTALFTGNDATADGGAISMTSATEVQITNATFVSNTAKAGGAISMDTPYENRRIYENCLFHGNTATDGGAVSLYGGAGLDSFVLSVFRGNYASNGGAAYIIGTLDLAITSTSFEANKAEQEGLAVFLAVRSKASSVNFTNVSFANNAYRCPLGQYGYDQPDQNVSRFEIVCQGCPTVASKIPDGVRMTEEHARPSCTELPGGTVALSSDTTVESISLEEGYFRTSNDSSVVVQCYRSEACKGGTDPSKYCADGYEGAYCSICAEGFSRGIAYSCRECSKQAWGYAVGVSLTVAVAVAVLLVAAVLLKSLATVAGDHTGEENGVPQGLARSRFASCQGLMLKVLPLPVMKIVVVVWQIVYQFSSIAETVYPRQYETFISCISFTTFDIGVITWYSCVFSPNFYDRLLLATLTPLVVLLMLVATYCGAKKTYRNSTSGMLAMRDRHLTAASFVVVFVYSSVSSTILQTFRCDPLDDGVRYLQADYSLTCTNAKHKAYTVYASLMLIVYPLGIPALFCWWLVRNRKYLKLSDRQTMAHLKPFNSLWGTYKPSRYYYEVVECCRRITLSAASVFFIPNSVNQIAIVLSLALVFLFVSESMSPFQSNADMSLYRWGNGVVLASMYVALLMKADTSDDELGRLSVLAGVLITANIVMIAAILIQSLVLAQEWRNSMSIAEEIIPPVRRYPLGATNQALTVAVGGDSYE